MSNRAVSATYRTIIDDVIANVRQDFEDMGIEKEVLDELQRSWEAKIVATAVADFEGAAPVAASRRRGQQSTTKDENGGEVKDSKGGVIKTEDGESGPSTSGETSSANGNHKKVARTNGTSDVHGDATSHSVDPAAISGSQTSSGFSNGAAGGNDRKDGDATEAANNVGGKRKRPSTDDNEIGSDLDDSDDDEMEGNIDADGNEDMILCLYDKVQRVRNKWKCVLKDGVASIDGRDYVFSKLSSELEW